MRFHQGKPGVALAIQSATGPSPADLASPKRNYERSAGFVTKLALQLAAMCILIASAIVCRAQNVTYTIVDDTEWTTLGVNGNGVDTAGIISYCFDPIPNPISVPSGSLIHFFTLYTYPGDGVRNTSTTFNAAPVSFNFTLDFGGNPVTFTVAGQIDGKVGYGPTGNRFTQASFTFTTVADSLGNFGTLGVDPNSGSSALVISSAIDGYMVTLYIDNRGQLPGPDGYFDAVVPNSGYVTFTPLNHAPVADDRSVTTPQEISKAVTLTASDADNNPLSYSIVTGPAHGTLTGDAPDLNYTPSPGYSGPDSFTFTANDGTIDSNTATVSITVTPRTAVSISVGDVSGPAGTKISVTSTLKRSDTGAGLPSETVTYKVDGVAQGTKITGANGKSSFNITIPASAGNHALTVEFAGDAQFLSGTGSATVTATVPLLASINLSPASVNGGTSSTGTVTLSGAAVADTVVSLSNSNGAATVPANVTVNAGNTTATFTVTTVPVAANTTGAITGSLNAITKSANLTVKGAALASLSITPANVIGGALATGTINLTTASPVDTVVALSSGDPAAAVPVNVVVAAGATSATFPVTTSAVAVTTTVTVTATFGAVTKSDNMTVKAAALASLSLSPTSVIGGAGIAGTVTLNGTAAVDTTVTLSSANPAVNVPASVLVPAGASSATFSATTSAVGANTTGAVTASLGTVTKSVNVTVKAATYVSFTLTPNPVVGGNSVTGTVTMSGPAAVSTTVTLTNANAHASLPAGPVTIPPGASSATFTLTTTVTHANANGAVKATVNGVTKSVTLTVTP